MNNEKENGEILLMTINNDQTEQSFIHFVVIIKIYAFI